jgi:entericidin B
MNVIKKCLAGLFLLGLVSMFLAGCNTVEGLGEDIESGGESIQDAAD